MSCEPINNCCETTVEQIAISMEVSFTIEGQNLILIVGNKKFTVALPESSGGGGGTGGYTKILIPITSNSQTIFTNVIPAEETIFALFLNGVLQEGNYSTSGGGLNLVWEDSTLETTDKLVIWTST